MTLWPVRGAENVTLNNPTVQAYGELQTAFDHYNKALFDGQLPLCLITMQREKRTYGYFSAGRFINRNDKTTTDEIALNPSYFGVIPLLEILQTIVHEMAHAWQLHHGTPGRRGYHNKEWAEKMESIGLMPSSTGEPGGAKTGEKMADYAIPGGRFLLATAELLTASFEISWLDRCPPVEPGISSFFSEIAGGQREGDSELAGMLSPVTPGTRSNRDKYRCPTCKTQVWGKPGLALLCGADGCKAGLFELVGK